MRWLTCALILGFASAAFAPAAYGQTDGQTYSIDVDSPNFPRPMQTAIVGLALTAVAVIGARVGNRSSDTMMYLVLGSLALTAVMVAFSDRLHSEFVRAGFEKLDQLSQQAAALKKS